MDESTQKDIPSLGGTMNEILDAFRDLEKANCGIRITEALIVGSGQRFRWQGNGKLGLVVNEYCLRDATGGEYDELEEAVELGQAQVYTAPRYVAGQMRQQIVFHQATGTPLDPNSEAARKQRERWARADAIRLQATKDTKQPEQEPTRTKPRRR